VSAQVYVVCELHEKMDVLWAFIKSHLQARPRRAGPRPAARKHGRVSCAGAASVSPVG